MHKALTWAILATTSCLLTAQAAVFPRNGAVKELTTKTWDDKFVDDGTVAVVAFTAPWCGHCQNMAPHYSKAAESLSPLIPFYNVNCDEQVNKPLCSKQGIKGFPTIKSYTKNAKKGEQAKSYEKARTTGPMIEWASDLVGIKGVKKMKKASEIAKWKETKPDQPHAILLHPSNPSIPLLWKVLSTRLSDRMQFAFLKDDKAQSGALAAGIEPDSLAGGRKKGLFSDATEPSSGADGVRVITWGKDGQRTVYSTGVDLKFEPLYRHFRGLIDQEDEVMFTTLQATTTMTETVTASESEPTMVDSDQAEAAHVKQQQQQQQRQQQQAQRAAEKAAKKREMEQKWAEEERRDAVRRAEAEKARLAKLFADQERVTEEQDANEDAGPVDIEAEGIRVVRADKATVKEEEINHPDPEPAAAATTMDDFNEDEWEVVEEIIHEPVPEQAAGDDQDEEMVVIEQVIETGHVHEEL